ncbi:MAG: serine protease [Myxococcaceae bacterium]|nr:serine protease [Myxococcaceae bacterium]
MLLPALTAIALVAAPAPRPTSASLRKAFLHNAHTVVEVSGGRRRGAGVIVGAGGQIVTAVDHVALDHATVHLGGRALPARVIAANARLGFAVVEAHLPAGVLLQSPPVRAHATLEKGMWLVGIARPKKDASQPEPLLGRILVPPGGTSLFAVTDLPLAPGSPLFDTRGRLVAIAVAKVGRIGSKALPLSAIEAELSLALPGGAQVQAKAP